MELSKSEYARHRGVSPAAVSQAIKAGRIAALPNGKIDAAKADAQWGQNSRPRVGSAPALAPKVERPTVAQPPATSDPITVREAPPWQESKARQAAIDADKAEIELAKMVGALVDAGVVRAEFARRISAVREGILQIPARLAPVLAAEVSLAVVQTTLDAELRAVLEQFAEA